MKSLARFHYCVTGYMGTDDMTAYVIFDKKNNSIHIHFYGNMFGNQRRPILVKHANTKFPDGNDVDLVKQIVVGELPNKVQIEKVVAIKEDEIFSEPTRHPQRTIIRFKR